jgi:transcriptional regulator with XRE-family HTH domain
MTTGQRAADVGGEHGRLLVDRTGRELRQARLDRALTLADVARALGISESEASRIERGLRRDVGVVTLARYHAVVGLELSVRSLPGGGPLRDAAHAALLADLRALLPPGVAFAVEVPMPIPGDLRSWDALIRGPGWRYGVEAETAPRDAQALLRRLQLKRRDGRVDGIVLLLRSTAQTRRFLGEAGGLLAADFPVPGRRALALLQGGLDPGGSAVVVLPLRRRP